MRAAAKHGGEVREGGGVAWLRGRRAREKNKGLEERAIDGEERRARGSRMTERAIYVVDAFSGRSLWVGDAPLAISDVGHETRAIFACNRR